MKGSESESNVRYQQNVLSRQWFLDEAARRWQDRQVIQMC